MDGHDAGHTRRVEDGPGDPTTVWGREPDGVRAAGTPTLADERLYVPADAVSSETRSFHRLYALDASTGETRWWAPLRIDLNGTPAVVGDSVLLRGEGRITALSPATGEEQWSTSTSGAGGMVVSAEALFVTGDGGRLLALGGE